LYLVEAGEIIQAVKLTKCLYGLSTTDAKAVIDDLSAQKSSPFAESILILKMLRSLEL
jgi:hypothetical protein